MHMLRRQEDSYLEDVFETSHVYIKRRLQKLDNNKIQQAREDVYLENTNIERNRPKAIINAFPLCTCQHKRNTKSEGTCM